LNAIRRAWTWVAACVIVWWISKSQPQDKTQPRSARAAALKLITREKSRHDSENAPPDWMDRVLMWGSLQPFWFAVSLVLITALLAVPALPASSSEWVFLIFPDLPSDYTHAAFFGTVWSVQATLVALVYPIVLTFVPILLQRRASSRYALAVYMHDSGVVPAGTSSLLLLVLMSIEYLASPYIDARFFLFAAFSNGLWFVANLALTTRFLMKTVKYVRGEFGEAAFRRLAIHLALRRDLLAALSERIVEKRAYQPGEISYFSGEPLVKYARLRSGDVDAVKGFSGKRRLEDVNVIALNWVVRRWLDRVPTPAPASTSGKNREPRDQPTLEILPTVGEAYIESADLARATKGPRLTPVEVAVLLRAFTFKKASLTVLDGTTTELLEELASEVQSQFERGNFATAAVEFEKLRDLHVAFVAGASATTDDDEKTPLVQLRTPWSWSGRPLGDNWMDVYRALIRSSVSRLDADSAIWEKLAAVPSHLVAHGGVREPAAVRDLLQHFLVLDHFLSSWWRRRIHQSQARISHEGAWLPQPDREDYQDAVIALVSALSSFGSARWPWVSEPDVPRWDSRRDLAKILLHQLDHSAMLLIGAVARGDASAARWHCDNVLHWLSSHSYEFEKGTKRLYFVPPAAVAVDVFDLSREGALERLDLVSSEHERPVVPEAYLWHAMQRHWEAIRLVCSAVALQLGGAEDVPILGATVAAALSSVKFFQEGLDESEARFDNLDDILLRYVDLCCIDNPTRSRMHSFVDQVQRGREMNAAIPNWMYSGSRIASNPEALASEIATMLLALDPPGAISFRQTLERIGALDEIDTLRQAAHLLDSLIQAFQPASLGRTVRYAGILRKALDPSQNRGLRPLQMRSALVELRAYLGSSIGQKLANLEVNDSEVAHYVQRLSQQILSDFRASRIHPRLRVRSGPISDGARRIGLEIHHDKESFTSPPKSPVGDFHIEQSGKHILSEARRLSIEDLLASRAVEPVLEADDSALLIAVAKKCDDLARSGATPVVLAPVGDRGQIVYTYRWGWGDHPTLPHGVELGWDAQSEDGDMGQRINGYAVIRLKTPGNQFYVLPQAWMTDLVFEEASATSILEFEVQIHQPSRLSIRVSWRAELQEASRTT